MAFRAARILSAQQPCCEGRQKHEQRQQNVRRAVCQGHGIGLGVGMAVGAAAGLMMQPQKKRANGIVADAVRTVSDVTDTIRDTMGW